MVPRVDERNITVPTGNWTPGIHPVSGNFTKFQKKSFPSVASCRSHALWRHGEAVTSLSGLNEYLIRSVPYLAGRYSVLNKSDTESEATVSRGDCIHLLPALYIQWHVLVCLFVYPSINFCSYPVSVTFFILLCNIIYHLFIICLFM
jgi:hypothetical protein